MQEWESDRFVICERGKRAARSSWQFIVSFKQGAWRMIVTCESNYANLPHRRRARLPKALVASVLRTSDGFWR